MAECYIKCNKCNTEIKNNTNGVCTPCKCGAIAVDGNEYYVRIIGNTENWSSIQKENSSE